MNRFAIDPTATVSSLKRAYSPSSPSSSSESSSARKRPRVAPDATSEEKKEARAARNRIAAQESRDRRKRDFADLHQRVAELEAENVSLRQANGNPSAVTGNERTERLERENAELLERVARLEAALTNVLPLIQGSTSRTSLPTPSPSPLPSSFLPLPAASSTQVSSAETTRHLAAGSLDTAHLLDSLTTPFQPTISDNTNLDYSDSLPIPALASSSPSTSAADISFDTSILDDLHASFDFSSLDSSITSESSPDEVPASLQWLLPSVEETPFTSDSTAVTTPASNEAAATTAQSNPSDVAAPEATLSLEQTLLTLFNNIVGSSDAPAGVSVDDLPTTSAALEAIASRPDLSSIIWPQGISL